jgi:hypothetical protein
MAFLGLCLCFAGIALINGIAAIPERDAKTTAFINRITDSTIADSVITGSTRAIGNFIRSVRGGASLTAAFHGGAS